MKSGKLFHESECKTVAIYEDRDRWNVWLWDWLHSSHDDEVQAVMAMQRLLPHSVRWHVAYNLRIAQS